MKSLRSLERKSKKKEKMLKLSKKLRRKSVLKENKIVRWKL